MPTTFWHKAFWPGAGLLLLLNLFTRLPWLLKADKFLDADHAVWGLMARHIAQGLHFPYYMYGQGYMGAGETYFLAPFFALWGASPTVMAGAMTLLLFIILLLNALLIRRLAGPGLALASLLLAALAPPFFIRLGLLCYGGYSAVLFFGVLLWLAWTRVYLASPAPELGRRGWRLALVGLVALLGWWTWTLFWLMVLPCLAFHLAFLAGRASPGLGPSRYGGRRPWWDPLALVLAVLALAYLGWALLVLAWGRELNLPLPSGLELGSDPVLALHQDLPLAVCLLALAGALYLWPRVERWTVPRLGAAGRAHLWGLAVLGLALGVKQLGDAWFMHSALAAWGRYVPPMLPAGPERIWQNLALVLTSFAPEAWEPHPPLAWPWLAWLLFAAGVAAALAALLSLWRPIRQRGLAVALAEHWLAYACGLAYLSLLAALIFTTATVNRYSVRYLWVSVVWWPFLLAWGVAALYRRAPWRGLLAGGLLVGVLGAGALAAALHPAAWARTSWRDHYGPLLRYMDEHQVRHGRADYWEAYKLDFLTGEKLIFTPDKRFSTSLQRYHPYYYAVRDAPCRVYLFRPQADDKALRMLRRDLAREGKPYQEADLGRYRVILPGPPCPAGGGK